MITKRLNWSRESLSDDELDENENTPIIKKSSTTRKKSYKKWTKDEDDRLREFMNCHSDVNDWSNVSKYVGNGRTDAQCQHRWERFLDPSITKGPWTDEEDKKVIELVRDYGARHWSLIAKELKGRVGKQCRERWHNHLNPLINKNPWTNEDNLRLFILHQHFGNKWAEIAKYFNGRSDNSIKNHWNSSMKKKFHLEVENLKKQGLDWTALIPPDFSWPKIDSSVSTKSTPLTRMPLGTITNQTSSKRSSIIKKNLLSPLSLVKTENYLPISNSNDDRSQSISTDDLEHLLFDAPLLTSSQHSQSSSSFLPVFTCSSSPHLSLLSDEDLFLFKSNENLLASPPKYHVLNTPDKTQIIRASPSPKRDCFNEYLPFPESVLTEYYSSIRLDKYDLTKNLEEKLGYNPTYTEILIGQTRDQRYVTEQARRYLSL